MLTKKDLYRIIDGLIMDNGFSFGAVNYCVDSVALAKKACRNVKIELLDFKTINICGILFKTAKSTSIGLNSRRSAAGRNFDCMHELIHYWLHNAESFYCDQRSQNDMNDYIEWQANEGAAQFLMPYQVFIPAYMRMEEASASEDEIVHSLGRRFNVGGQSVKVRIASLQNEIAQYKNNVPMDKIEILSRRQQMNQI